MLIRLKSSSLGLVVIDSISMSICNRFYGRLANNGQITTFRKYHSVSLLPLCANFLKPRRWRLRPLKFKFNAESFIRILSWSICSEFGAIRSSNVSRSPKLPKIHKTPYFDVHARSSKIIALGGNRKPVYDLLLVINSSLGIISHHFWDTTTYWQKIANFPYPLSFSALARGDLCGIYGKLYGSRN